MKNGLFVCFENFQFNENYGRYYDTRRKLWYDMLDKDMLILSEKLSTLSPEMLRIVENIIDECNRL